MRRLFAGAGEAERRGIPVAEVLGEADAERRIGRRAFIAKGAVAGAALAVGSQLLRPQRGEAAVGPRIASWARAWPACAAPIGCGTPRAGAAHGPAPARDVRWFLDQIEPVFPGTSKAYTGRAYEDHWSVDPWHKGAYS